ncbi:uncharacterized protein [Henckelia pumila]|uniref:uncharacterized protein n=1 Tax=Henckelia pumila TaxID=405737 RepID=UPI003C6E77A5
MDAAAGGSIFSKFPIEAYVMLEQMTINSYQWPSERYAIWKTAETHEVDAFTALTSKMATISTQLATLTKGNQSSTKSASLATAVNSTDGFESAEQAQYVNNRNFNNYRGNPAPNQYHPNLRNLENFSYANNKNVFNLPPGFNTQNGEGKPSLEDLASNFISKSSTRFKKNENRLDSMETHLTNVSASMKNLKTQIGQLMNALNNQQRGEFPSNTEVNPREQCKAVTLRYGKEVGVDNPKVVDDERFKKKALDGNFSKFLDVFKKININISFADALEQMPPYAKFMKNVMSRKRKLKEFETAKLTEECSAILKKKLPQKLKDPGIFTIPCIIRGPTVNRELCDLGASINLMPISIFRFLELGVVKPSTITLQLADRSLTPQGVVEDVLVKVDKFIFPADFVVLDMKEDQDVPLIFGRPFLATGRALIDVQDGELTLRVGGEAVTFNIYKTMKYQEEVHSCNRINLFNSYENNFGEGMELEDALARCLINSVTLFSGDDWELREKFLALESLPKEKKDHEKIEELPAEPIKEVPVSNPELKDLPGHLCYAFLGENSTYPFLGVASTGCAQKIRLAGYQHYCFLNSYFGYNQIAIAPEDQEKTTFTYPMSC